jgi:hypothetical protein
MKSKINAFELLELVLKNAIEITATGFMVRSAHYDEIGGVPHYPNLLYADTELWLKLILQSYLAVAPEICFEFRFHVDNTSKSAGKIRLTAFERMVDFFVQLKNENNQYKVIIEKNAHGFLRSYAIGSCHKLMYLSKENRNAVTMENIISSAKKCAQKLLPGISFEPEKYREIFIAKLIDSNSILRRLFLTYKSFKKRTF